MALATQVALTQDEDFRGRVRMAAVTAAVAIAGEAQGGLSNTAYGKRQALATAVLNSAGIGERGQVLDMFVWAVAQNESVTAASNDGDIQFTVNAVWSDCAGVSALD